jgi:ATP-binding cassette subfamily F protein uup
VSHDREFLDNVVTQTLVSSAAAGGPGAVAGEWKEYAGGYSDWQRARAAGGGGESAGREEAGAQPGVRKRGSPAKAKLSYKESRELAELPARVHALEKEQREITASLGDPAMYRGEPERVRQMQARFAELEEQLMQTLARWEALEAKR